MEPRVWMAVLQPTPFCNIDCRYCYLPDRQSTKRIGLDTLAGIGRTLFRSPYVRTELTFLWHAGEPLVLPPSFYAQAFAVLDAENHARVAVRHIMQTNATLLDHEWCAFIRDHGIGIGVSLDGPAFLHDASRVDRAGNGTFARTLRGVRLLKEYGIPVRVIAVLTRESLDHPDALWDFFMREGIRHIGFNIEEIDGVHAESSMQCDDAFDACRRFFDRLLDLRDRCGERVWLREADPMIAYLTHGGQAGRTEATPLKIVTFDCDGNLSSFSPELMVMRDAEGGFMFGAPGCDLTAVVQSSRFRAVAADIAEGVSRCRTTCEDFALCGGGSPSNKLAEHGSLTATETMDCRLKVRAMARSVRDHLRSERAPATLCAF